MCHIVVRVTENLLKLLSLIENERKLFVQQTQNPGKNKLLNAYPLI